MVSLSFSESVSVGTLLPLPTANDPDYGEFSVTGYRLQADQDVADTFELQVNYKPTYLFSFFFLSMVELRQTTIVIATVPMSVCAMSAVLTDTPVAVRNCW